MGLMEVWVIQLRLRPHEVGGEAGGGDGPEGVLARGLAGVTAADDGEDTPGGSLVQRYIVICRFIDR